MVTIGVEKYLANSAIYKHKCLENTNNLYKSEGKCDDYHQLNTQ